jgi:hypothetical protein
MTRSYGIEIFKDPRNFPSIEALRASPLLCVFTNKRTNVEGLHTDASLV